MIALFVGFVVFLVGAGIAGNAAFSDRAILGAWIAIGGALIFIGGVIEVAIKLLFVVGV